MWYFGYVRIFKKTPNKFNTHSGNGILAGLVQRRLDLVFVFQKFQEVIKRLKP